MKQVFSLFVFAVLVGGVFWFFYSDTTNSVEEQGEETHTVEQKTTSTEQIQTYTIQSGDTFATALERFGISYQDVLEIVDAGKEVYDFTTIKVGYPFRYTIDQFGNFLRLEYDISTEEMAVVQKENDRYIVTRLPIQYEVTTETAAGDINSSLFVAGAEAGLTDKLVLELAEIFAWTIDFATEVRQGDAFSVVYETRMRNGVPAGTGNILAASFTNQGKTYYGYRYKNNAGDVAYYDQDGNSLVKQFLKAPLTYNRITSGYTKARFHPVTGTTMPHRAIDYAAAVGTPVLAVGDGVVTMAKYNGGFGNYIDIRHNGMYETQYAHLSRYAKGIKPGVAVTQGQVIGYVGSTGWSTGPHLHYQIRVNGTLVNPLEVELPAGDPISPEERVLFEEVKQQYHMLLKTE